MKFQAPTSQQIMKNSSIPLKLLYDCEHLQITVELENEKATGKLIQVDDLMNLTLDDVIKTDCNGERAKIDRMMIRGSLIQFVVLPPILKYSPFLKSSENKK